MKLIETTNNIQQIGNVTEENTFKMKSSRKAFQILSDLYSDKPLAIVRELGCNAADSMTASGKKDQPFAIHLPNALEPWLAISDFGTGISHENIYNIYATYFESTKTNTNDQVGCLGLGSKSPFCYTDTFSVESTTDGIKRTYNAFFNQSNTPAIALMSTDKGGENGVTIKIPVKSSDFDTFKQAVQKAFRFFKVKPIITGATIDWKELTSVISGNTWECYKDLGYQECFAIMGGVAYPVIANKLDSKYFNLATRAGLVIYFEMGEIDFTPSREALSYCPDTIKALNAKMAFVIQDFQKQLNDTLKNEEDIYKVLYMVQTMQQQFSNLQGVMKDLKWKGQDVTSPQGFISNVANVVKGHSTERHNVRTYYKPSYYRVKISESMYPEMTKDVVWYYDDMKKGALTRVRDFCRDNSDKKITLFNAEGYKRMLDKGFDKSYFKPVSILPAKVKAKVARQAGAPRAKKGQGAFNLYFLGDTHKTTWDGETFDATKHTDNKFYIVKGNSWDFSTKISHFKHSISSKQGLLGIAKFLKINKNDIIMVSEQNVKRLPKSYKPLFTHLEKDVDYTFDATEFATYETIHNDNHIQSIRGKSDYKSLPTTHEFKQHIELLASYMDRCGHFEHIKNLLKDYRADCKPKKFTFTNPVTKILVDNMGRYGWDESVILTIAKNTK